jgi:hypothetical protein
MILIKLFSIIIAITKKMMAARSAAIIFLVIANSSIAIA